MALPLLLGLLGSGLASSGMLGGIGALTAGALGSGIGTAIETGDIGKGVSSGLMSFLGGKFIGSALGADPLSDAATQAATQAATEQATQAAAQEAAKSVAGETAKGGLLGNQGIAGKFNQLFKPDRILSALNDPTKELLANPQQLSPGLIGKNAGQGINALTSPQVLPYVAGAQVPNLLGSDFRGERGRSPFGGPREDYEDRDRAPAPDRITRQPPPDYRPGIDPEFDYRVPIYGVQHMAEGGIVDAGSMEMEGSEDKRIVSDAVAALRGEVEDPRIPLGIFLKRYGEEALRNLIDEVTEGGMSAEDGFVRGTGDGLSDEVPASTDSGGDVALSDGEFVVPADVVSHIGNGSSEAGASRLMEMMDRVRQQRTGNADAPGSMNYREMLPS